MASVASTVRAFGFAHRNFGWPVLSIAALFLVRPTANGQDAIAGANRDVVKSEALTTAAQWQARGIALRDSGKFDDALAAFDNARAIGGKTSELMKDRGNVFLLRKRFPEALQHFNESIALDPLNPRPLNNRGLLYQQTGRLAEAIADFTRAIELTPEDVRFLGNRAIAYDQLRCFDEALADRLRFGRRAKDIGGYGVQLASSYRNLAANYQALEKTTEAREAIREAVRLASEWYEPEHAYVADTLMAAAKFYESNNNVGDAIVLRRQVLDLSKESRDEKAIISALDALYRAYTGQQQWAAGEPYLRELLALIAGKPGANEKELARATYRLCAQSRFAEALRRGLRPVSKGASPPAGSAGRRRS